MFLDRWIVMPHFLTMMCGIEKNGISIQNKFAQEIQTDPNPFIKHVPYGLRFTCQQWKLSLIQCKRLTSKYRTIVVKRDPIERFVSAFKSKCANADGDGERRKPLSQLRDGQLRSLRRRPCDPCRPSHFEDQPADEICHLSH